MNRTTHETGGRRPPMSAGEDVPESIRSAPGEHRTSPDRRDPTLADLAWAAVERRWTVVFVAALALLATAAYLVVVPPVYETSTLVQVEGRARPAAAEDVIRFFDTAPHIEGEMRLLQSRELVAGVVEKLALDVKARPRYVPLVGAAIARWYRGEEPAPAPMELTWFALARFGWGGEVIRVAQLAVPADLVDEPLTLVARGDGAFELKARDGRVLVAGTVGKPAAAGDADRRVSILVSELKARPGTEFVVRRLHRDEVIRQLLTDLTVTEQGKDTGLVELTLKGTDPALIAKTLEAMATSYVRRSLDQTSDEAANALRLLDDQLPILKSRVAAAEAALDRFHRKNVTVNLSLDGARLVARMGEVEHAITEAELGEMERTRRHTSQYPEATDPAQHMLRLKAQRESIESQIHALPGLELEYARLVRQVGVETEHYTKVLNRAEELRTAKSEWVGNARVVEKAVEPRKPVSPKKGLAVALAALIGIAGGFVAAFLRSALDAGIRDPDEVEGLTGIPVFATIPHSAAQQRLAQRAGRRGRIGVLSAVEAADGAVEDLRSLRTGVEFALRRAKNSVVVVASPAPRAGKSFVSVNLAYLMAGIDGRVLLVDGDLRRGGLERYFGLGGELGVADVLLGEATLDRAVHRTDHPNLDVLPVGKRVTNPAELLASAALRRLLDEARARYKCVVVDGTPILSVTDAALIARDAGVTLLVVRAEEQNRYDVSQAVKRLVQNGATIRGAVLNDVRSTLGHYGRSGGYRRYDKRDA